MSRSIDSRKAVWRGAASDACKATGLTLGFVTRGPVRGVLDFLLGLVDLADREGPTSSSCLLRGLR